MDRYYRKQEKVNEYSIIKIIGEGRYGIAYLAENASKEKVVIKQLKKKMLKDTRKKLFYERKILKSLDNPEFPKFIGNFRDKYREGYILEYIEGRVFYDCLSEDGEKYTKEEIYNVAEKLLGLMEILHKKNIVHRDIRLPNVIVKENKELALIDFGLARFIDNKKYTKDNDYWYLGDFLIHLYYSSLESNNIEAEEKPWYEELDLTTEEELFLKRLMSLEEKFVSDEEVRNELNKIRNII